MYNIAAIEIETSNNNTDESLTHAFAGRNNEEMRRMDFMQSCLADDDEERKHGGVSPLP